MRNTTAGKRKQLPTGVYLITCAKTGTHYVGGTTNRFSNRITQHKYSLRKGVHRSEKLQADWDKYGEREFVFSVLARCPANEVAAREQHFIDLMQPGYNTWTSIAGIGHKLTPQQRERMKLRPQSVAKLYEVNGERLSLPNIAAQYGVQLCTLRKRVNAGKTGSELIAPAAQAKGHGIVVGGKEYTPRELADFTGLPLNTIYSRLNMGWVGDDLALPRKRRGRNSRD